jgi:hypothetical protein
MMVIAMAITASLIIYAVAVAPVVTRPDGSRYGPAATRFLTGQ